MASEKPKQDRKKLDLPYSGGVMRGFAPVPLWAKYLIAVLIPLTFIPITMAFRGRYMKSEEPRRHFFQGMGINPRYNPQSVNEMFADGRAMRPKIAGTVARGRLDNDDHYWRGYTRKKTSDGKWEVTFVEGYPKQIKVDEALVRRGQERYNIYCASCHAHDGRGQGPVAIRGGELGGTWVAPANLHGDLYRARPEGHVYNTINNGIRSMGGYGAQISVDDRWAIVAYVRALQLSQQATEDMADGAVPPKPTPENPDASASTTNQP